MLIPCWLIGHKLINTLKGKRDASGFYEFEESKVCARCGELEPASQGLIRILHFCYDRNVKSKLSLESGDKP